MVSRESELKYALAASQYFNLRPRDYYSRWNNARLLCLNMPEQLKEIQMLKERVETIFGCSILNIQLLLETATDLEQSWTVEYAPMRTRTMTVYEAVGILDSFREQLDTIIAKNFLMLGGWRV